MLSLAAPMWLFGLVLLPVMRWLHRGGRHRRGVPVSRLGLWQGLQASRPAAGERRPPDPAWRRRALLTALVFVALAEPQWPQQRPAVTLWVDDSLSMLTREPQGTRLAQGMAQARSLLSDAASADVEVRTLGDPWQRLAMPAEVAVTTLAAGAGRVVPGAPPAALLRRDRLHWLVTDGAHAALLDWPGGRQPDRLIRVGSVTRNVGLERLSARRNLADPGRVDLLLKVTNGGVAAETRAVVLATDAGEVARSSQRLDPATSALVAASIPASARVRATLQPGDALAEDDTIVLDLAPLKRHRVAIDPTCPGALLAAVATHPALAPAPQDASDVEAALECGSRPSARHVATLRVLADHAPMLPRGPLRWASAVAESRRIRLDAERLQLAAQLQARPADVVLLAAGDAALIIGRAGASKLLETSLDFASMATARGPEVPLLVNLMFERLLGGDLLDRVAITDRGPASAVVAPPGRPRATAGTQADVGVPVSSQARILDPWASPILGAAVLVLLWEIVALGRQLRRDSAGAGPE